MLDGTYSLMHFCGYRGKNKKRDQLDVSLGKIGLIMSCRSHGKTGLGKCMCSLYVKYPAFPYNLVIYM